MSNKIITPDFDEMYKVAEQIGSLQRESDLLDITIKDGISRVTALVLSDEKYLVNGKPASMEYIKSVYHISGLGGELLELRNKKADLDAKLETAKLRFQVMRDIVTIFVTDSANIRASIT